MKSPLAEFIQKTAYGVQDFSEGQNHTTWKQDTRMDTKPNPIPSQAPAQMIPIPKISFGSWAFSFGPFATAPWSFSKTLSYAAESGYDGIEINGFRPHPHHHEYPAEKRNELKREIAGFGLGVSGYAPDFSGVPPAQAATDSYLEEFQKALDFCVALNIPLIRVDTVEQPRDFSQTEYAQRFTRLVNTWRSAAESARKQGVLLVWEFEPGFWLNRPSEVMRLVDAIDREGFKVLFDTSHAYMGAVSGARQISPEILSGGVAEYALLLGDRIGHLHFIDSDGRLHDNETSTHIAFGEGLIHFDKVCASLSYQLRTLPWCCVDFCFNPEAEVAGKTASEKLRSYIRSALRSS